MYDTYVDKWVLVEFGVGNTIICRTTTSDPRDSWESWVFKLIIFRLSKLAFIKTIMLFQQMNQIQMVRSRSYIITKSDLNNSGGSTSVLNLKTLLISTNWDKTINGYQNPFTPQSENYKPDWGIVN